MKVYFRDLGSLKKEAKKIKSTLSTCASENGLKNHFFYDVVANMYGWASWNAMHCAHSDRGRTGEFYQNTFLLDLDEMKLEALFAQKKRVLAHELTAAGVSPGATEAVVLSCLVEPYRCAAARHDLPADAKHIDQAFTEQMWRQDAVALGQDGEARQRWLHHVVNRMLSREGGLAILGEKEASWVIDAIRAPRGGTSIDPRVVMADGLPSPLATHHVSPLQSTDDEGCFRYIEGQAVAFEREDRVGMWLARKMMFYRAFYRYCAEKHQSVRAAYQHGLTEDDLQHIVDATLDTSILEGTRALLSKHLESLGPVPSNVSNWTVTGTVEEHHQYLAMGHKLIREVDFAAPALPSLDFVDSLKQNRFIVVVVPDNPSNVVKARVSGLLWLWRYAAELSREAYLSGQKTALEARVLLVDINKAETLLSLPPELARSTGWSVVALATLHDVAPTLKQERVYGSLEDRTGNVIVLPCQPTLQALFSDSMSQYDRSAFIRDGKVMLCHAGLKDRVEVVELVF